jgi:hypothetical protein
MIHSTQIEKHQTYGREIDNGLCVPFGSCAFSHSLDTKQTFGFCEGLKLQGGGDAHGPRFYWMEVIVGDGR